MFIVIVFYRLFFNILVATNTPKMYKFYEIEEQIGAGSYGIVHLCNDKRYNRKVVLKIINLPIEKVISSATQILIDTAKKEVELLLSLDHINIVHYYDSFFTENKDVSQFVIVMEYCNGGDLAQRIIVNGRTQQLFPEKLILHWLAQLLLAIQHMHSKNILHRDLKPSNIYLMSDDTIKLGDFGVAKELKEKSDMAQTVIGTPYSMSPELCNSLPYSYASDIWGLGCVLYELLTLKKPFEGKNVYDLVLKIVQQEPDYTLLERYNPELQNLVKSMLLKTPESRPTIDNILELPFLAPFIENSRNGNLELKHSIATPRKSISNYITSPLNAINMSVKRVDSRRLSISNPQNSADRRGSMVLPSRDCIVGSSSESTIKPLMPDALMQATKHSHRKSVIFSSNDTSISPSTPIDSESQTPLSTARSSELVYRPIAFQKSFEFDNASKISKPDITPTSLRQLSFHDIERSSLTSPHISYIKGSTPAASPTKSPVVSPSTRNRSISLGPTKIEPFGLEPFDSFNNHHRLDINKSKDINNLVVSPVFGRPRSNTSNNSNLYKSPSNALSMMNSPSLLRSFTPTSGLINSNNTFIDDEDDLVRLEFEHNRMMKGVLKTK